MLKYDCNQLHVFKFSAKLPRASGAITSHGFPVKCGKYSSSCLLKLFHFTFEKFYYFNSKVSKLCAMYIAFKLLVTTAF